MNEEVGYRHFRHGFKLMELSRFSDAIKEFQKGMTYHPSEDHIIAFVGLCYYNLENYTLAEKNARISININPNNDYAHYILGETLLKLKQFKKCKEHFETAIQLAPRDKTYLLGMAKFYASQKSYQIAESYADKSLEIDPKFQMALIVKAALLTARGKNATAITVAEQALSIDPTNKNSLGIAAIINDSAGDLKKAELLYHKILQSTPSRSSAYEYIQSNAKSTTNINTTSSFFALVLSIGLFSIVPITAFSVMLSSKAFNTIVAVCSLLVALVFLLPFIKMMYTSYKSFGKVLIFKDWQQLRDLTHSVAAFLSFSIYMYTGIDFYMSVSGYMFTFGLISVTIQNIDRPIVKKFAFLYLGVSYLLGLINFIMHFSGYGSSRLLSQILFVALILYVVIGGIYFEFEKKKKEKYNNDSTRI